MQREIAPTSACCICMMICIAWETVSLLFPGVSIGLDTVSHLAIAI